MASINLIMVEILMTLTISGTARREDLGGRGHGKSHTRTESKIIWLARIRKILITGINGSFIMGLMTFRLNIIVTEARENLEIIL